MFKNYGRLAMLLLPLAVGALDCGKAIGGEDDAAQAAGKLGEAGTSANSGAQGQGLLAGAGVDATVTVTGKSGSATVTLHADTSGSGADVVEDIVYANFSADGKNTFDGNVTQTVSTHADATGASSVVTIKGKVTMTGDYDSVLDVDYKESLKAGLGGASFTLDGRVTADGKLYQFENASFTATTGG